MGMVNAQRTQNIIRVLTEFINQPQYRNVIPMFGIINEAQAGVITPPVIRS
jgi:glucan 1,3-beta-glucosidase